VLLCELIRWEEDGSSFIIPNLNPAECIAVSNIFRKLRPLSFLRSSRNRYGWCDFSRGTAPAIEKWWGSFGFFVQDKVHGSSCRNCHGLAEPEGLVSSQ
jgi:hypothetical protein